MSKAGKLAESLVNKHPGLRSEEQREQVKESVTKAFIELENKGKIKPEKILDKTGRVR